MRSSFYRNRNCIHDHARDKDNFVGTVEDFPYIYANSRNYFRSWNSYSCTSLNYNYYTDNSSGFEAFRTFLTDSNYANSSHHRDHRTVRSTCSALQTIFIHRQINIDDIATFDRYVRNFSTFQQESAYFQWFTGSQQWRSDPE